MYQFAPNRFRLEHHNWDKIEGSAFLNSDISDLHRSLPEYSPTPAVSLPSLAAGLGLGEILVKDESLRFGLKAFKALGSTYAIYHIVNRYLREQERPGIKASDFYRSNILEPGVFTFCTATDGNHGRAVAWVARKLRQKAVIYMPGNSVPARIRNIEDEEAAVKVVDGSYDDAVRMAAADADKNGWQIVSDTSWPDYEEIPRWIMAGYLTMFDEIHRDGYDDIDFVFIQAGVGAFAAAAAWFYNRIKIIPGLRLISVEPTRAACLLESIKSPEGHPVSLTHEQDSIMAGLNCGTPSQVAWPYIKSGFDLFLSIPDKYSIEAMRKFYYPGSDDPRIVSGESGAAGLGALIAFCRDDSSANIRAKLHINTNSKVLLINTEGATDPVGFERLVLDKDKYSPL